MLQYVKKAAELLEAHLQDHNQLPPWVCEKVLISAQSLGMSVSYIRKQAGPKETAQGLSLPQKTKKVKAHRGDV